MLQVRKGIFVALLPLVSLLLHCGVAPAPDWTEELIIYEIATKGFTSPNGPETGTFNSLKEKLPYLKDLGINGIWLTGHSLADKDHFYNIWTQYAVIHPDKIDPSLGTRQEFRSMIAAAHQNGIRVFLDVITHGVMSNSPLVQQKPHWFKGGTWGMTDFNWDAKVPDLDQWWVDLWTNNVLIDGVDGFRLDVDMYRPDLWNKIRKNCADAGKPIVVFNEGRQPADWAADFVQADLKLDKYGRFLKTNVAGFLNGGPQFSVEVRFTNGTKANGSVHGGGELKVTYVGITLDKVSKAAVAPDGEPDIEVQIKNIPQGNVIEEIILADDRWGFWNSKGGTMWAAGVEGSGSTRTAFLSQYLGLPRYRSVQLSSHDNGWEGFTGANPYEAQGSRCKFAYAVLFSGLIPLFMSGEEFNATYTPIPWLSPKLFGQGTPGTGRWMYGNMVQWGELSQSSHKAMFDDVKKMIAIRKQNMKLVRPYQPEAPRNILEVPFVCADDVPVPYIRWKDNAAIVVLGNSLTNKDVTINLDLPLGKIGLSGSAQYRVTDLWTGQQDILSPGTLGSYDVIVKRDKVAGGGFRILKIEPF